MTTTAAENPDLCYLCRRDPAMTIYGGMCPDCFARAVWFIDPPWSD